MKKKLAILTILLFVLVVAAACGRNQSETSDADEVHLRFMWWGGEARHTATLEVIDLFTYQNPHIRISAEYTGWDGYSQRVVTQMAGEVAPDIIQLPTDTFRNFMMQGVSFSPLDQGIIDLSNFSQDFLEANLVHNGVLMGLPTGGPSIATFFYNADFLDYHNIPRDTVWNWDNLVYYGRAVQERNPDHFLVAGEIQLMPGAYLLQTEGAFISPEFYMEASREGVVRTFQRMRQLLDEGVVQPIEETVLYATAQDNTRWVTGRAGMYYGHASTVALIEVDDFELGITTIQATNARDSGFLAGAPQYMVIPTFSQHPEEAAKFLDFFFNDPEAIMILRDTRGMPPTTRGRELMLEAGMGHALMFQALEIVTNNQSSMIPVATPEMNAAFDNAAERVFFGVATPEQAADDYLRELEEILATVREDLANE